MESTSFDPALERRETPRVAAGGQVSAVVVDAHGRPLAALEQPRMLNVSAGGAAMVTCSEVPAGAIVALTVRSFADQFDEHVLLKVLDCVPDRGSYRLRCRLTGGRMPACLIHGW